MDDTATASSTLLERVKRKYPALPSQPPLAIPQKADGSLLERIKNKYPSKQEAIPKPIFEQPKMDVPTPELKKEAIRTKAEVFERMKMLSPEFATEMGKIEEMGGVKELGILTPYAGNKEQLQKDVEQFYVTGEGTSQLRDLAKRTLENIEAKRKGEIEHAKARGGYIPQRQDFSNEQDYQDALSYVAPQIRTAMRLAEAGKPFVETPLPVTGKLAETLEKGTEEQIEKGSTWGALWRTMARGVIPKTLPELAELYGAGKVLEPVGIGLKAGLGKVIGEVGTKPISELIPKPKLTAQQLSEMLAKERFFREGVAGRPMAREIPTAEFKPIEKPEAIPIPKEQIISETKPLPERIAEIIKEIKPITAQEGIPLPKEVTTAKVEGQPPPIPTEPIGEVSGGLKEFIDSKVSQQSGFSPNANYFNTPKLQSVKGVAWRGMGQKELDKVISGEIVYKGGVAGRANSFAPTPGSATQYITSSKGKFLVEFNNIGEAKGETITKPANANNIVSVKRWDGAKFTDVTSEYLTKLHNRLKGEVKLPLPPATKLPTKPSIKIPELKGEPVIGKIEGKDVLRPEPEMAGVGLSIQPIESVGKAKIPVIKSSGWDKFRFNTTNNLHYFDKLLPRDISKKITERFYTAKQVAGTTAMEFEKGLISYAELMRTGNIKRIGGMPFGQIIRGLEKKKLFVKTDAFAKAMTMQERNPELLKSLEEQLKKTPADERLLLKQKAVREELARALNTIEEMKANGEAQQILPYLREIRKNERAMIQDLYDAKIINKDTLGNLNKPEWYVPLERVFEGLEDDVSLKFVDELKGITGQTEIANIFTSISRKRYIINKLIENNTMKSLIGEEAVRQGWARRITGKMERKSQEAEQYLIRTKVDGTPVTFALNPNDIVGKELAQSLRAFTPIQLNAVLKFSNVLTKALQWSITRNPAFWAVRNIARDVPMQMFASKTGSNLISPAVTTFKRIIKDPKVMKYLDEFELLGMKGSTFYDFTSREELEKMVGAQFKKPAKVYGIKSLANFYEQLVKEGELLSRFNEFVRAREKGINPLRAAQMAREVTVNFAREGMISRQIGTLIPFFGAGVQGASRAYRLIGENPRKFALLTATFITTPSVIEWYLNRDNPTWRNNIARQRYYTIDIGDRVILIPKLFEIGAMFGTIPTYILDYIYDRDPKAALRIADTILGQIPGTQAKLTEDIGIPTPIPGWSVPLIEQLVNKKLFTGREIVPYGLQRKPAERQYREWTPMWVRELAGKVGMSPLRLQALIEGVMPGISRSVMMATTPEDISAGERFGRLMGAISPKPKEYKSPKRR